jgi:hypothetical protein
MIICTPCRQAGVDGRRARIGQVCCHCGRQERKQHGPGLKKKSANKGDIILLYNAKLSQRVDSQGDDIGEAHLPAGTKGLVVDTYKTPEFPQGVMVFDIGEGKKFLVNVELDNWGRVDRLPTKLRSKWSQREGA